MKSINYLVLAGLVIAPLPGNLFAENPGALTRKLCAAVPVVSTNKQKLVLAYGLMLKKLIENNDTIVLDEPGAAAKLGALLYLTRGTADQWVIKKTASGNTITFDPSGAWVTGSNMRIDQDVSHGGTVTFNSVTSTGAALVLDADVSNVINMGATNATTVTIGNVANTTAVELPYGYVTTGGNRYISKMGTTSFFAGVNAGPTTSIGTANVGIGVNALATLSTTATRNTAVGFNALTTVTESVGNTAIGYQALVLASGAGGTNGSKNTAVGDAALATVATGYENTAIGYHALTLATGISQTAVGSNALATCSTGAGNTAVGYNTLTTLDTGIQNTAVGYSALALATGTLNTAIGAFAASTLGSGNGNVFLGTSAGGLLTSGSNNIYIGYNESSPVSESNTIRMGFGAGATNCYIAGIFARGPYAETVTIGSDGHLGSVSSAQRYKENIQPLDSQDRFMQLKPMSFNYKNDSSKATWFGLIAEDVAPIYPELAIYQEDGQLQSVAYLKLDGIMVREIQQNRQLITGLQALLTDQQKLTASQQTRIESLEKLLNVTQ